MTVLDRAVHVSDVGRVVVLDVETTGLYVDKGHRVIEIGAVELIGMVATGVKYHCYLNPDRDIDFDATTVHGITIEHLLDKPRFRDIAGDFLDFIGNDHLVIHNSAFDVGFLNAEFKIAGVDYDISVDRVIDTLELARELFPGAYVNLDSLCQRFNILLDIRKESGHGALLDADLLSKVFVELLGGLQVSMNFSGIKPKTGGLGIDTFKSRSHYGGSEAQQGRKVKSCVQRLDEKQIEEHKTFVAEKIKDSIWQECDN